MSNRKFRHEMSETGSHRIVDLTTNTVGPWALYDSPAFLFIDMKMFSALTNYYRGVDSHYPPIETVFEMINCQTELGEAQEQNSNSDKRIFDIEVTSLKEFTDGF